MWHFRWINLTSYYLNKIELNGTHIVTIMNMEVSYSNAINKE
jgi:hypothetical protein